jgi:hypothetical protein
VFNDNRQYSNTVNLDTVDDGTIYYHMPSEYTKLDEVFAEEFEQVQADRKKMYDDAEKKKKEKETEDGKILMDLVNDLDNLDSLDDLDKKTAIEPTTELTTEPAAKQLLTPLDIDSVVNNINSVLSRRH